MDALGVLRSDGDRAAVRFEREYATTIDNLWSALTEPDRVARWLAVGTGDFSLGGTFRLVWDSDESTAEDCEVLACERPRRLEVAWSPGEQPSVVSVELTPTATGTMLVLDHRRLASPLGTSTGWHWHLAALGTLFDGGAAPGWDELEERVQPQYARQLDALTAA
jgi:uncharacterized protein YndB with AHSA1/START domain